MSLFNVGISSQYWTMTTKQWHISTVNIPKYEPPLTSFYSCDYLLSLRHFSCLHILFTLSISGWSDFAITLALLQHYWINSKCHWVAEAHIIYSDLFWLAGLIIPAAWQPMNLNFYLVLMYHVVKAHHFFSPSLSSSSRGMRRLPRPSGRFSNWTIHVQKLPRNWCVCR